MPLYSDYGMYYGGGGGYSVAPPAYSTLPYAPSYTSSQYGRMGVPVTASPYSSPLSTRIAYPVHPSRYSPMLSTITETPYSAASIASAGRYAGVSSLMRINSPKLNLHSSPKYVAPRPVRINTADLDVSSARYKRSLPILTSARISSSIPLAISSSGTRTRREEQEQESRRSHSETPEQQPADETRHFMPRCDENDAPPEQTHRIKRDRTIVRISTVRQRSKGPSERPALASERGPPAATPAIVVDVSNITMSDQPGNVKRTWRDNFGEDLLVKPKEAVRKTPGELLLERHLIKSQAEKAAKRKEQDEEGDEEPGSIVDIVLRRKNSDSIEVNKMRRPSFHDICQEISSDKIESVDDLNAGELRRRASLLPDEDDGDDGNDDDEDVDQECDAGVARDLETLDGEGGREIVTTEVQQSNGHSEQVNANKYPSGDPHNCTSSTFSSTFSATSSSSVQVERKAKRTVNTITKSASGTLHCLLERHLHNSGSAVGDSGPESSGHGSRRKSVKRVHHKITAKVHIDEPPPPPNAVAHRNGKLAPKESATESVRRSPQLNAIVEHVSEELHHVNHVAKLPGKKATKEAMPKKIIRGIKPAECAEEDFWGAIGTRETTYCNNRRQNMRLINLQTCSEEVEEERLQFQESVLSECPQSPTVEQKDRLSLVEDIFKQQVMSQKGTKATTLVMAKDKKKASDENETRCKTTVAEKFERCENNNGLKIAATESAAVIKKKTTKPTRDSDAKSPARCRRVIDSSHEEVGENRNKQTPPVSSITTPTTTTPATASAPTTQPTNGGGQGVEAKMPTAAPKKKKMIAKKTTTDTGKKKIATRTKIIEEDATSASGESSLTSSTAPADKQRPLKAVTKAQRPAESPSGGSGKSSSGVSSTTSTLSSVAAALTTSSDGSQHQCTTAAEDRSIPGNLSKFATIDKLNLLSSVDSEMAIEISRGHKADPASAAAAGSSSASIAASESAVSATNSGDGMDRASPSPSLSPSSSTGGAKKKRVVRKVVKRIRQSPAERSNSDVNIGIWSVMPHKKGAHGNAEDGGAGGDDVSEDHSDANDSHNTNSGDGAVPEGDAEAVDPEVPKETIQELIRRVKGKPKKKASPVFDPQKCQKFSPDSKIRLFTVDEKAPKTLWATPRPLQKQPKKVDYSSDEESSEGHSDAEETPVSSSTESEEANEPAHPEEMTLNLYGPKDERMSSTCSNDSGFEGGTAPSSPKNMLECDVNCHKKCEKLTANLCGVNQKLIVEALSSVRRGAHEPRDSPSTPPSHNPAFKIDSSHSENDQLDTSYTYAQYQRSGRITAPATSIPRFRKYTVEDFHFLAVLGKGSFGKVLLAELRNTEYYYAVKCLKKDVVLEDDDVECTLIERKVLALGTKHPYLCHLFCTFQTESHLFFVMEYLNGGDLMFHIQTSGRFPESRARFYAAEIISGLKFLHKKGIVYRDLKLDNVLLDFDGHVRIADFGMCKLQIYLDRTADSFCGTPDYMAPEIIKGQNYNQTVDWWSFGVLLYEMLIGQSPFSGCDEDELFWSICNETPWIPGYLSKEATNIVKALLEKDASIRLGGALSPFGDIVDHRFFNTMNWQKLEHRELDPPFKPAVRHPLDTQYFDQTFTKERVRLTPIMKEILHSMDQEQFQGFSYTNPNATLT